MCRSGSFISVYVALFVYAVVGDGLSEYDGIGVGPTRCYWREQCTTKLYATRTPYDTARGDLRDQPRLKGCKAISVWALMRHGNRHPGKGDTADMNALQQRLKDQLSQREDTNKGPWHLCAQDIENLSKWKWNSTLDSTPSYLTDAGYNELYALGARLRQVYPDILASGQVYVRATLKQRTQASAAAFLQALNEGTNLNLTADQPRDLDSLLRPYDNCTRYQNEVKHGQELKDELDEFYKTSEYLEVQKNVNARLGVSQPLTVEEVFTLYELCRFDRTWAATLRSPWCAVFSPKDLIVLEYRDDVRHYYKNGYGSKLNLLLGQIVVKDLYESMEAARQGRGRSLTAYFSHDTLLGMVYSALGLHQDSEPLTAWNRNPLRNWRTSYTASFASNIMVVLNECDNAEYKVQILNSEKPTELCPLDGCSWEKFSEMFKASVNANLSFCNSIDFLATAEPVPSDETHRQASAGHTFVPHISASILVLIAYTLLSSDLS